MKKIFVTLAVAGLMLTGCTKNETVDYGVSNPDVIAFSSFTSRAPINKLETLMNDEGGFKVYGVTNGGQEWHTNVDGTNNYAYAESNWGWKNTPAEWSMNDNDYPMTFYAMYPAVVPGNVDAPSTLTTSVTILATASTQVDMLAAKASAPSKPASGKLSMTFDHILSKVNLGVIPGHSMKPEILLVKINNVNNNNTYNYVSHAWGSASTGAADYVYFQIASAAGETPATLPFTVTGGTDEDVAFPIYTGTAADAAHLMLMPQAQGTGAPAAWDFTVGTGGTLETNAFIEVIYRITDVTTPATPTDYIGFTNASSYIYDGYPNNITWDDYTNGLGDGTNNTYNGAFYIRVGFPVTVNWLEGKGYIYNICLGTADSTNGYYIDNTYYDEEGNDTGVPILSHGDPVVNGDPVTSGVINFLLEVNNWDDNPAATPLQ